MFDDRALIFRLSLRVAEGLFKSGGALKVHEALARERRLSLRCFFCAQETSLSWPIGERTLSAGIIPLRISLAEILQPLLFYGRRCRFATCGRQANSRAATRDCGQRTSAALLRSCATVSSLSSSAPLKGTIVG
jgi:hypothetical protein